MLFRSLFYVSIFILSFAYAYPSSAGIISNLKAKFDREVGKTVGAMAGSSRVEAEKFLDTAFSNHINPTLNEIDRMIIGGISELDQRVQSRIEQLNLIVTNTLNDVREGIRDIDSIRSRLVKDITRLQGLIIDNVYCATDSLRAKAKADLDELVHILKPSFFELLSAKGRRIRACRRILGLPSNPDSWQLSSIYDLKKCSVLASIDISTPAVTIKSTYLDLAGLASTSRCVFRSTPDLADGKFTPEIMAMRRNFQTWAWVNSLK